METDKMSTASSVGTERRPLMQALVLERRILFAGTILVGLCTFLWITAVCTSKWVHIEGGAVRGGSASKSNSSKGWYGSVCFALDLAGALPCPPISDKIAAALEKLCCRCIPFNYTDSRLNVTMLFMSSDSGVWEICRNEFLPNATSTSPKPNGTVSADPCTFAGANGQCYTLCTNYLAQPEIGPKHHRDAYDSEIASLVRTMTSFGIISLFVMTMGCGFSMYTFRNPRYMFKRLASGIHFISTACTFVVVQVMTTAVDDLKKRVPAIYPKDAYHYYHISFYLAVFVVLINFGAGASFLWYSRKRKGDKAATDELAMADEPTIIGR